MLLTVAAGILMLLAALALNTMLIVQGFRISKMRGLLALLAPLLLGAGLSCLYLFAHRTALSEVGAKEVQQQGDQEFEDQKAQLDGLEDLKL